MAAAKKNKKTVSFAKSCKPWDGLRREYRMVDDFFSLLNKPSTTRDDLIQFIVAHADLASFLCAHTENLRQTILRKPKNKTVPLIPTGGGKSYKLNHNNVSLLDWVIDFVRCNS